MHFRNKHIADSVTERIMAISDSISSNGPAPESKGAATIQLQRSDNGDLLVTKTFEHGESELLTISGNAPTPTTPEGFADVTPAEQAQPIEQQLSAGIDDGGIVGAAALGGDSLDALLRT